MSTILFLEEDHYAARNRNRKAVYAIVRFFDWDSMSSKKIPDLHKANWKYGDLLAITKGHGPADALRTYAVSNEGQRRGNRFTHSVVVALPVSDLHDVAGRVVEKASKDYTVFGQIAGYVDHDGNPIPTLLFY